MGKYISLGEYNKLYKYIWMYLIIRFLSTYIFSNNFIFEPLKVDAFQLPGSPFITNQFDYIVYVIISIILIIIEKRYTNNTIEDLNEQKLIYNEQDINTTYGIQKGDYFLFINIFFLVIRDWLEEVLPKFNNSLFTFWMFEMLYYELFSYKIFKTNIYRHHIFSFFFILISGCLLRSINIIIQFENNTDVANFFEDRKWLIPISILVYFLFRLFKTYTFINIKYYFDKRVISITKFIFLYGLFGVITTFIGAIISTYAPCGNNTLPELSKRVCNYEDLKDNNETIYYFDSYKVFFEKFSQDYLGARIIISIFRSIFNFGSTFYIYIIYKKLSPIYYICLHRFNVLILKVLIFFNDLINNEIDSIYMSSFVCESLILVFYILGSIIYLEFIELNFCKLNFYTKRNIKERSNREITISLDNISVNSDADDNDNVTDV